MEQIRYSIMDPAGNITALAELPGVGPAGRAAGSDELPACPEPAAVAAEIMRRHPEVEQVGFVSFPQKRSAEDQGHMQGSLRMAGGEFCGNASMCAAALYVLRTQECCPKKESTVCLRVSGAEEPVKICLRRESEDIFSSGILMPPAKSIDRVHFTEGGISEDVPVVRMQGISHAVIEHTSGFSGLLNDRAAAERAVREWCGRLLADGFGLIFLGPEGDPRSLTPLVYVPGSGTVFWEHSCASGSAAAGMYLACTVGEDIRVRFSEPGGILQAEGSSTRVFLSGSVRYCGSFLL